MYDEIKTAQRRSRRVQNDILLWHDIRRHGPQNRREEEFARRFTVRDDSLWYLQDNEQKLVVPRRKLIKIISLFHEDTDDAGHPGVDETTRAIRELYYARNLRRQVTQYVKKCLICHSVKARQVQQSAPQRPHSPTSPFETLSTDVLGPYPTSAAGNRFIIIVEDIFTKWTEAKAVPEAVADQVCEFLEGEVFSRFGNPRQIISDNGPVFASKKYLDMCTQRGIQPFYTAVYNQRENPVERRVADFKTILRTLQYEKRQRNLWDTYIPRALSLLRARKNRATGETPCKALLGYDIARRGYWEIPEYVERRRRKRQKASAARRVIRARQLQFNEQNYPAEDVRPKVVFRRGDRVMVKEHNPEDPFSPRWSGPHEIAICHSTEIYEVDKNGRQFRYHIDHLRPAPEGNLPEPEELDSDGDAPSEASEHPEQDSSDDEPHGPVVVVTKAQVHVDSSDRDMVRPADTGIEYRTLPTSGKSTTSSRSQARNDKSPGPTQPAKSAPPPVLQTHDAAPGEPDDSQHSSEPPRPAWDTEGPVILRRPRWRRRRPAGPSSLPGPSAPRASVVSQNRDDISNARRE